MRADVFKSPFSIRKGASVLTAMGFDLNKKMAETVANMARLDILTVAYNNADKRGGDKRKIVDRIEAFAYLVGYLVSVAMPV